MHGLRHGAMMPCIVISRLALKSPLQYKEDKTQGGNTHSLVLSHNLSKNTPVRVPLD